MSGGRVKKKDKIQKLYDAVIAYVESKSGNVVVIGGIEIQEWPDDREFNFRVAIRCTGRRPELKS